MSDRWFLAHIGLPEPLHDLGLNGKLRWAEQLARIADEGLRAGKRPQKQMITLIQCRPTSIRDSSMSLSNAASSTTSNKMPNTPVVSKYSAAIGGHGNFVERRRSGGSRGKTERRQFGSSYSGLSEAGRELALAIDRYKLEHHRRYITCDEMLHVITQLGYSKDASA